MLRFWDQASCAAVAADLEVKSGLWSAILLRYEGIAATGKTMAATDFGVLRCDQNGVPYVNANFGLLTTLTNYLYGRTEATSAEAGAFAFTILIPLSMPMAGAPAGWNSRHFAPKEGLIHIPAISAALTDSVTISAYGLPSNNPEIYGMQIFQQTETLAAGTVDFEYRGNLMAFLIANPATTAYTQCTVTRDDLLVYACGEGVGEALTDILGRIEHASLDAKFIDLNPANSPNEIYSAKTNLGFIGGVGALTWIRLEAEILEHQREISFGVVSDRWATVKRAKAAAGQKVPIIAPLPYILAQSSDRRR